MERLRNWWLSRSLSRLQATFEIPKSPQNLRDEADWWERHGDIELARLLREEATLA